MVYRGRSGADPEKKGEDVFPSWVFFCHCLFVAAKKTRLGTASNPPPVSGGSTHLDKGYSPTDVLSPLPGATDVLDVMNEALE